MSVSESFRQEVRAIAEQIRPVLARMEEARLTAIRKRKQSWILAGILAVITLVAVMVINASGGNHEGLMYAVGYGGAIITLLVAVMMGSGAKNRYLAMVKEEVFTAAVSRAVPGIDYKPFSMIPRKVFEHGGLFDSRIDKYFGEDCFAGKHGATNLTFSELLVQRVETRSSPKGGVRTQTITVFKGIYLVAEFHKEFACRVEIMPDVAEATFGWLGRKMQGISGNLVRLESPEFEKAFKVTSDDAVGARYLLTPEMQERFLALRGEWSKDIRAVLMDSSLHLAIPNSKEWFEPRMDVPADDLPTLHGFLVQLMLILKITETLDLDTRIWTKE